jgi:uncharacterized protein (DUF305 family)
MRKAVAFTAGGLMFLSAAAYAQMQHGSGGAPADHGGMMHDRMDMQNMQIKGDSGPSSVALNNANIKMHSAMDITYTGNSDVDFVKGMIPHHAGAIDMARVVLTYGKDPEIKKLAEGVIKAQEAEIAQMQAWLKKNGQ